MTQSDYTPRQPAWYRTRWKWLLPVFFGTTTFACVSPEPSETSISAVAKPDSIELSWAPSSDNVAVAGYRIWRDGTLLAETQEVVYQDRAIKRNNSYTYAISAFDTTNNELGRSEMIMRKKEQRRCGPLKEVDSAAFCTGNTELLRSLFHRTKDGSNKELRKFCKDVWFGTQQVSIVIHRSSRVSSTAVSNKVTPLRHPHSFA